MPYQATTPVTHSVGILRAIDSPDRTPASSTHHILGDDRRRAAFRLPDRRHADRPGRVRGIRRG